MRARDVSTAAIAFHAGREKTVNIGQGKVAEKFTSDVQFYVV